MSASADELRRAIDALRDGQWDTAHEVAQATDTPHGHWLHGIVHAIEGDENNARYWYARAGRPFPGMEQVEVDILALRAALDVH
ncbi:MAG: hypothetical protein QM639_14345 [Rhodocyclaceae bacterium]